MNQTLDLQDTSIAFSTVSNSKLRKSYYIFGLMNQKYLVKIGTFLIKMALRIGLPIEKIIEKTIFDIFCGGETVGMCKTKIENLAKAGIGTILDYSVEGEANESSYDKTANEILLSIKYAAENKSMVPYSVFKVSGIGSFDLMTKLNDGEVQLDEAETNERTNLEKRFEKICELAANRGVKLLVDAEETWIQNYIDNIVINAMKKHNKNEVIVFNTYQLYRHESFDNLKSHVKVGKSEGYKIGAKIVRGAYMEKERDRAEELGYNDPINPSKESTDTEFNKALSYSIDEINDMEICIGTHNLESTYKAVELIKSKGLLPNDSRIYFAQLLGMCDVISYNLSKKAYNTAKYVPYGPIKSVMPYLFRRADENTSIAGQTSREFSLIQKELKRRKNAKSI